MYDHKGRYLPAYFDDPDFGPYDAFQPEPGSKMPRLFKKDNNVPPPDPRLVAAQIRGIDTQNELINVLMANSRRLAPLQEQQMRQAISAQDLAQRQSQEDRTWTLGRRKQLTGLQDTLVNEANTFNSGARAIQLGNEARADVNQAFDSARGQALRSLTRTGVNPNSGRASATQTQLASQQALALATAANKTREAARQEGFNMKSQVMNALAGYPSMGMQATGQAAGFGLQGMAAAVQGLQGLNSGYAQALQGATNMTNSASNAYGVQANAYNQSQQGGDTFGDLLGGVAAVGGLFTSDRRLKEDIEEVGVDTDTGLTLYEFGYRFDPEHRRYRGVMADEVLQVMPEAVREDDRGFLQVDYGAIGIPFEELNHGA